MVPQAVRTCAGGAPLQASMGWRTTKTSLADASVQQRRSKSTCCPLVQCTWNSEFLVSPRHDWAQHQAESPSTKRKRKNREHTRLEHTCGFAMGCVHLHSRCVQMACHDITCRDTSCQCHSKTLTRRAASRCVMTWRVMSCYVNILAYHVRACNVVSVQSACHANTPKKTNK